MGNKEFDLNKANRWMSANSPLLSRNSGKWVAVGMQKSDFAIIESNDNLSSLLKNIGSAELPNVLVSKIPAKNQVCFF